MGWRFSTSRTILLVGNAVDHHELHKKPLMRLWDGDTQMEAKTSSGREKCLRQDRDQVRTNNKLTRPMSKSIQCCTTVLFSHASRTSRGTSPYKTKSCSDMVASNLDGADYQFENGGISISSSLQTKLSSSWTERKRVGL